MEFWGVEVKSGQSVDVEPGEMLVHLSQACLDEVKKGKGGDSVSLFVKTSNQKLVLGILSSEKFPQISFDLVFEKKFELSHNWKNGSVYFTGYKSTSQMEYDGSDDESDSEEDVPLTVVDNGKPALSNKSTVTIEVVKKDAKSELTEASSYEDESDDGEIDGDQAKDESEEDSSDEEDESDDDSDGDDETDDSEEEDDETPKKADVSKKRPAESTKTPAIDKKAKFVTPEKTGGKKGSVHIATPYPTKQAGKKPVTAAQTKQQTPKSGSAFTCISCKKSFNSDGALQSHNKAKHSGAK